MTDQELFFKYNMRDTQGFTKEEALTQQHEWPRLNTHKDFLVLLHATYACNCACIYCENGRLREKYGNKIISKELLTQVIEKLGPRIRELTWHGGESTLIPDDYFILVDELEREHNFEIRNSVQTNGILLDQEKLQFYDSLGITWGTSFDGMHNTISRGQSSTDGIMRLLNDYHMGFGFIQVIYKDTVDEIIENYEWLKKQGFTQCQSCIVRENVLQNDNEYIISNKDAVKNMLGYIDYWIHDTNNPLNDVYVSRFIQRVLGKANVCEDTNCIGGWLIIDPDGNIGLCGHAADDGTLCNIEDIETADDLLSNKKYMSIIGKQMRLMMTCESCKWFHVCYGGCMGLNFECDPEYKTISPRNCEYIQQVLEGIYELIKNIDVTETEKYNHYFLDILRDNNYFSLDEIKRIENAKGLSE